MRPCRVTWNAGRVRSEIDIRQPSPADFDLIAAVMDEWWGRSVHSILPRLFLDHFCDTSLLAQDISEELAGFLIGFGSSVRDEESYVHAVAVSPRHRGDGLGRELYRRFFEASTGRGRPVVRAVTSPFNERSIAFHRRVGFCVSDPVPDYDGPGLDRVVFRINLHGPRPADR